MDKRAQAWMEDINKYADARDEAKFINQVFFAGKLEGRKSERSLRLAQVQVRNAVITVLSVCLVVAVSLLVWGP